MLFSTPPSLRATSPIWLAPHRGGVLNVSDSETEIPHKATGTRQWRSLKYLKRILALSPCAA